MVVVAFGGGGDEGGGGNSGQIIVDLTASPGRGVTARSITRATVREGPGNDYLDVGLLGANQNVEVVGRNNETTWYQIFFPIGSQLRGWVPASALRLPDGAVIPTVEATPITRPVLPTATPPPPVPTETAAPPTPTEPPPTAADLEGRVASGSCVPGQRLIVTVTNRGPAALTSRAIAVAVVSADGVQRSLTTTSPATLPVGGAIDIDTQYVVQERVAAIVDPQNVLGDPNPANNRVDCVVAGSTVVPQSTRTPTPNTGQQQPSPTPGGATAVPPPP
jgi:hypothetical protein